MDLSETLEKLSSQVEMIQAHMSTNTLRFRLNVAAPTFQYLPTICIGSPFGHQAEIYGTCQHNTISLLLILDPKMYKAELLQRHFSLRMLFLGKVDSIEHYGMPLHRENGRLQWKFTLDRNELLKRGMLVDKMWLRCRAEFGANRLTSTRTTERMQLRLLSNEVVFEAVGMTVYARKEINVLTFVVSGKGHAAASLRLVSDDRVFTTSSNKRSYGTVWIFNVDTSKQLILDICVHTSSKPLKAKYRFAAVR